MNARAVISAIKTFLRMSGMNRREKPESSVLSQALQNRIGAVQCGKGYEGQKAIRCGQTVCCDHLVGVICHVEVGVKKREKESTFTSGSLFITFFILAKGRGG
jgi:hypothetical protein